MVLTESWLRPKKNLSQKCLKRSRLGVRIASPIKDKLIFWAFVQIAILTRDIICFEMYLKAVAGNFFAGL